jgi:hypothetical protein
MSTAITINTSIIVSAPVLRFGRKEIMSWTTIEQRLCREFLPKNRRCRAGSACEVHAPRVNFTPGDTAARAFLLKLVGVDVRRL